MPDCLSKVAINFLNKAGTSGLSKGESGASACSFWENNCCLVSIFIPFGAFVEINVGSFCFGVFPLENP